MLAAGCTSECTDNKTALPRADLLDPFEDDPLTLSGLQVTGVGERGDSVLIEPSSSVSEFYIPLRIDADRTVYRFSLNEGEFESTVTFDYTRTPRFVSAECGVSYVYDIRSIVCEGTLIDSVTCPEGRIDNTPGVNLHIWINPWVYETE